MCAFQGGRVGLVFGIPASVAMTEMMIRGNEPEQIYDRCFRLRHNLYQVGETFSKINLA